MVFKELKGTPLKCDPGSFLGKQDNKISVGMWRWKGIKHLKGMSMYMNNGLKYRSDPIIKGINV